jgi:peptide/nickel transport system substrate-binding protein
VRYDDDDKVVLSAFEGFWKGPPDNDGVIVKVVPDDTMRGLDLRKGATDLVINDLPPDIVHQLSSDGSFRIAPSPGLDFSYIGFNCGIRFSRTVVCDMRSATPSIATPSSGTCGAAWHGRPPDSCPIRRGHSSPTCIASRYDPARAMRLLDEAGYRDP